MERSKGEGERVSLEERKIRKETTHLLSNGLSLDVNVSSEDRRLLRNLLERTDELPLRLPRQLILRQGSSLLVGLVVELLVRQSAGLDAVLVVRARRESVLAHLVLVETAGLNSLLHVLSSRRLRREREGSVATFSDADNMEDDLSVGRNTSEDRVTKVEFFLPIGDLFVEEVETADEEGLTEETDAETEGGESSPDDCRDDGEDDEDGGEDERGDLLAGAVLGVGLDGRHGAGRREEGQYSREREECEETGGRKGKSTHFPKTSNISAAAPSPS